jgi:glutamine amidotransferase
MIAIIDYNMGNLASVYNALVSIDTKADIVSDPHKLKNYSKIILPGVGAFKDAIKSLKTTGMDKSIKEFVKTEKLVIGICLGMQLLFDNSEEFGHTEGLGIIPGKIVSFDKKKMKKDEKKVPHVGWNKVFTKNNKLFDTLDDPYLYFVHSFHAVTDDKYVIGTTSYGYNFTSVVQKDNVYGFQPHPEKSHNSGIQILKNFTRMK